MSRHANYKILADLDSPILIMDLGPWDKHLTITNDAEYIVQDLHSQGRLTGRKDLIYIDSERQRDRILHDGRGHFLGFA